MAAPTNLRVESNSQVSALLNWDYPGAADIKVYQSLNGSSYSLIATVDDDALTYLAEDLSISTKYWYKVSDDSGATFSNVVTVVTQNCVPGAGSMTTFNLPRFTHEQPSGNDLNLMATQVEEVVNQKLLPPDPCLVCITEGAVVFDCTDGCVNFRIIMTEDVNSIAIHNCGQCPEADFIIPPNVSRGICGWPIGCQYGGDECIEGPIPGGPNGRTAKTNGTSYDGYGPAGGDPEPSSCPCPPVTTLSIKCCEDSCVLNCLTNRTAKIKACGGLGPYSWSIAAGIVTLTDAVGVTAMADVGHVGAALRFDEGTRNEAFIDNTDCTGGDERTTVGVTITRVASACPSPNGATTTYAHFIKQHNVSRDCDGNLLDDNIDLLNNIRVAWDAPTTLACGGVASSCLGGTSCNPGFGSLVPWRNAFDLDPGLEVCGGLSGTVTVFLCDTNTPDIGLSYSFAFDLGDPTFDEETDAVINSGCPQWVELFSKLHALKLSELMAQAIVYRLRLISC